MVLESFYNHGLFVVVIFAVCSPIQPDFPQPGPELAGLQVLHSFGADGKCQLLIERGVRWTIEMDPPGRVLPGVRLREANIHAALLRVVSSGYRGPQQP